jgi:hypothetical protein
MKVFDKWGPATVLVVGLVLIAAAGGAVAVAVGKYSYPQYLDDLKTFAIASGLLGVGRGVMTGLRDAGNAITLPGVGGLPHDSLDEVAQMVQERMGKKQLAEGGVFTRSADVPPLLAGESSDIGGAAGEPPLRPEDPTEGRQR